MSLSGTDSQGGEGGSLFERGVGGCALPTGMTYRSMCVFSISGESLYVSVMSSSI